MRVIDLHGDTPNPFYEGQANRMVCAESTAGFPLYLQCAAFFCRSAWSDEQGYSNVCARIAYWKQKYGENTLDSKDKLKTALLHDKKCSVLCIEDARILAGDMRRADALFTAGVRIVTPLWRGVSCMGGAWDTDEGLTPFGIAAVERFLSLGAMIDLSHASRGSHAELARLCKQYGRAPIATHSNAFAVTPHPRNLTDAQIREIADCGGVIGINLYPPFLSTAGQADFSHILAHFNHLIRVGGERVVALGSDFDGVDALPRGIADARDLQALADHLHRSGVGDNRIDAFFFENAKQYFLKNFP